MRGRVFDGQGRPLAITKVDFGEKFEYEAAKYVSVKSTKLVAEAKVLEIKKRCVEDQSESDQSIKSRGIRTIDLDYESAQCTAT